MTGTLVIQSHRSPLPASWLNPCLDSVQDWARANDYQYSFLDDDLLDLIPSDILEKTRDQIVVATDLARLLALRSGLAAGFNRVVWCDADVYVVTPGQFKLPDSAYALGREVWVQQDPTTAKPRVYTKVHNAVMLYCAENPFLEFYIDTAQRLLRQHEGRFVAQFIGPKLLTAIHNIARCPVIETAGMLSPMVIRDLLGGGGIYLDLFRDRSPEPPAAVNLCASTVASGEISSAQMESVLELLADNPDALYPG